MHLTDSQVPALAMLESGVVQGENLAGTGNFGTVRWRRFGPIFQDTEVYGDSSGTKKKWSFRGSCLGGTDGHHPSHLSIQIAHRVRTGMDYSNTPNTHPSPSTGSRVLLCRTHTATGNLSLVLQNGKGTKAVKAYRTALAGFESRSTPNPAFAAPTRQLFE